MNANSTRFTLILGAGASEAFGLPLGFGLRNQIASDLNIKFDDWGRDLDSGSYEIVDALRLLVRGSDGRVGNINPHRAAAVQIAESMPYSSSIDEYIERHSNDKLKSDCAKIGIAKAILEAERQSKLYATSALESDDPLRNTTDSWIAFFCET